MKDVTNQLVLDVWQEVRALVESLNEDFDKNARGNSAAGVRARKGVRLLKKKLKELTDASLGKEAKSE